MTENNQHNIDNHLYKDVAATIRKKRRISPFWLLPFIALCIGALLFVQIIQEQGTNIKIVFDNGDGLVAGKTPIRYQGLQIGVVKKVNFTDNLQKVEVRANIYPEATEVLKENTKFWIVRPTASIAGISGIDALVSGNYITLQLGDGDDEDEFVAEPEGPIAQLVNGDLLLHLVADDLGSISAGSSVFFKKIPVGKVYGYHFIKGTQTVLIDIVIDKAYTHFVKSDSRFWNISGINANLDSSGFSLKVDSLNAVVQGAITFDSPEKSEIAKNNAEFKLYDDFISAKRGFEITVDLSHIPKIDLTNKFDVYYQNVKIGSMLDYVAKDEANESEANGLNQNTMKAEEVRLLIDPNMRHLFKENTKIVLRKNKLNLASLKNINTLLRDNYLDVIPGEGKAQETFTAINAQDLLLQQSGSLLITLTAPETYGVGKGEPVYYNNIKIGEIVTQKVDIDSVTFSVVILEQFKHLIKKDTLFVAASNLEVSVGIDGLKMEAATPEKWLEGGIRVIAGKKNEGKPEQRYHLYKSLSYAEMGILDTQLQPSITLKTSNLPSISSGSLVLYRQYEVGKILDIRPTLKSFDIDVYIYPKYQHLLTSKSVFWVEDAAKIDITPQGISIQASPVGRSLKGAISFDNIGGKDNKTLYPSEIRAKSAGQVITLMSDDATYLSKGMALRYMGLNVGQIENIVLTKQNKVQATALINGDYMKLIAKSGSKFKVISPEISAGGIQNLETILQPYIDIEVGTGSPQNSFALQQSAPNNQKYATGFPLVLEISDASNITKGSPIMYRGVDVGIVNRMELNKLGDRVLVYITIANKHKHLVRQNTEFWISAGYGMEIGFRGLSINTGSVQQLLKGGISFSTPSGTVVQPMAKANQHFLLQVKKPVGSADWNLGILKE
ncbi:paraquat-inducible protein B [Bisgaardia hudsonensis]|uniref:Paraquat-inducible protein B n=1 Tax=Bisgaardia hudsonensis TaxID=109472 RepID=A0A4R2N121_9PAST|nr:MlaD family protein [Bisgaardia hudsonensis]QLB13203.1 hypothetical protein A6A11_06040 [Bisgaardia hudsonensis]TCP13220.1 paraquat-inducible protein B [Bisgaardia hudsonensis]